MHLHLFTALVLKLLVKIWPVLSALFLSMQMNFKWIQIVIRYGEDQREDE